MSGDACILYCNDRMALDLSSPSTVANVRPTTTYDPILKLLTDATDYLSTMNSIHRDSPVDIISEDKRKKAITSEKTKRSESRGRKQNSVI